VLYQSEDRWIVSIGGYFGDHAPDDERLFAAYSRSLPTSDVYDIVSRAEPLSDFVTYRYPANLRRRYERLARFPDNYLVFGDAVCSFNPVYGQGMTVAAQEAALLHECLSTGGGVDLARRFFNAVQPVIDIPWDIAVGNDLRHPQVTGPRPAKVRFINWYVGKLHKAARHDGKLTTAFLDRQSQGAAGAADASGRAVAGDLGQYHETWRRRRARGTGERAGLSVNESKA